MPNARATAFWDMSFSDQQRVPWEVPASVRWSLLAPALGSAFGRLTGQPPLPSSALDYLSTKLCGNSLHTHAVRRRAHLVRLLILEHHSESINIKGLANSAG